MTQQCSSSRGLPGCPRRLVLCLSLALLIATAFHWKTVIEPSWVEAQIAVEHPGSILGDCFLCPQRLSLVDLELSGSPFSSELKVEKASLDLDWSRLFTGGSPARALDLENVKVRWNPEVDWPKLDAYLCEPRDRTLGAVRSTGLEIYHGEAEQPSLLIPYFELKRVDGVRSIHLTACAPGHPPFTFQTTRREIEAGVDEASFQLSRARLTREVLAMLPVAREIAQEYALDFELAVEGRFLEYHEEHHYVALTAHFVNAQINLPQVGTLITGLRGPVRILIDDNRVDPPRTLVRIREPVTGLARGGQFELSGWILFRGPKPIDYDLSLDLNEVELDPEAPCPLSPKLVALWNRLRPEGRVSAQLSLAPGSVRVERVELHGVDLTFAPFPMRIHGLRGVAARQGEELSFVVDSDRMRATGVTDLSRDGAGELLVELERIDLAGEIAPGLPPKVRKIWDQYQLRGKTGLRIEVRRPPYREYDELKIALLPERATLSFYKFPVPIEEVTGEVVLAATVESVRDQEDQIERKVRPERLVFSNLKGRRGEVVVRVDAGEYRFGEAGKPGRLELPIVVPNLQATREIMAALPERVGRLVESFGLEGSLSTEIRIFHEPTPERRLNITIEHDIYEPIRIAYHRFPYPIEFVEGKIYFTKLDNTIHFSGLKTNPNESDCLIQIDGGLLPGREPDTKHLSLKVEIDRGQKLGLHLADPKFRDALPEDARNLVDTIKSEGYVRGHYRISYEWTDRNGERVDERLHYQGEIDLEQGSSELGLKVTDSGGHMNIYGEAATDQPHFFIADVPAGYFRFNRFEVDQAHATIYYGKLHPWFRGEDPRSLELHSSFSRELLTRSPEGLLQISLDGARLYGGRVTGFLYTDVRQEREFQGHFWAEDLNLALGQKRLFEVEDQISGLARGRLLVSGRAADPESIVGQGDFNFRGELLAIPAAAVFLRNPIFGYAEQADEHLRRLREIDGRFEVSDGKIWVPADGGLTLRTASQEFRARGSLSFQGTLDLVLEATNSFYNIPGLRDFFGGAFRVHLAGPLNAPEVRIKPWKKVDHSSDKR